MEKTFQLTANDFRKFVDFSLFSRRLSFMTLIYVTIIFSAIFVSHNSLSYIYAGGFLVFLTVFIIAIKLKSQNTAIKQGVLGEWKVTMMESGLTFSVPNKTQTFTPWNQIHSILQNKEYFYIFFSQRTGIIIPKRELTENEQNQIQELLLDYTKNAPCAPIFKRKNTEGKIYRSIIFAAFLLILFVALVNRLTK